MPIVIAIILAACVFLPRIAATDVFVTTDELFWLGRSGTFARALSHGRFDQTFLTGHPGVTTMWSAVLSLGIERTQAFAGARREVSRREVSEQRDFIPALARARQGIGVVTGLSILLLAALTWRLYGPLAAIITSGLLALEPFLVAHSRLVHIDAELASFIALALLAALAGWSNRLGGWVMLGSGIATALALLAKAPAGLLLVFIPLLGLVLSGPRPLRHRGVWLLGSLWAAATALTYLAVWPAMWVAPGATLGQVLAFMRDNTNPPHALGPIGEERASIGPLFYVNTLLLRASPVTLAGAVLAVVACLMVPNEERWSWRQYSAAILGFVIIFGLLMTFAAKNFDRYLLPVFPLLAVLAGFGWTAVLRAVAPRGGAVIAVITAGILFVQAAQVAMAAPYFLTYFDPLAGGAVTGTRLIASGWGEGLDQVSAFLESKPNPERLRVGLPGEIYTTVLGSQTRAQIMPAESSDAAAYDYTVIYIRNRQLGELPPAMDEQFLSWQPERVVTLQGIQYAWIYDTRTGAPVRLAFADGSLLLGYSTNATRLRPGQPLQLTLFWSQPSGAHTIEARISRDDQSEVSLQRMALRSEDTPSSPARVMLSTPADTVPGDEVVSMRLLDANDQPILAEPSDTDGWVKLRSVEIGNDRR
ncbi:MAG TPA: glycosyltransferase family 39 protein [Chloroflexota bacterium]|nr:glycosyltransferase family 39 protein [Chloroflexota bacterium]